MLSTHPVASQAAPPAPDAIERELAAYNAAFDELELDWHWDREMLEDLRPLPGERARICAFLRSHRPHLLKVYDEAFLADLILDTKARIATFATVSLNS